MQNSSEKKKIGKQLVLHWTVALVLLIVTIVTIRTLTKNAGEDTMEGDSPEGVYEMSVPSGDSDPTVWTMTLGDDETYSISVAAGEKSAEIEHGTYVCEGNTVICTMDSGTETVYLLQDDFLIAEDYLYEGGDIENGQPSGTFSLRSNENDTVVFMDDGTFVRSGSSEAGGSYKAADGLIEMSPSTGETWISWLVVGEHTLSNAYYKKK